MENEKDMETKRAEAVEELRAAFARQEPYDDDDACNDECNA